MQPPLPLIIAKNNRTGGIAIPLYKQVAEELENRIFGLISDNLEILKMSDPWDLFKIPGFKCDDLGPSLFQAQYALEKAKERYINSGGD